MREIRLTREDGKPTRWLYGSVVGIVVLFGGLVAVFGETGDGLGGAAYDNDAFEACKAAEEFVSRRLVAPGSADFRSGCFDPARGHGVLAHSDNRWKVHVIVDSQNRLGATLRSAWDVIVIDEGDSFRLDTVVQIR